MEKTLVLIKPDAIANKHIGDIIKRYEDEGFKIAAMKLMQMTPKIAAIHYAEHIGKSFYDDLVEFMTAEPIIAMVIEGDNAISKVREINGATNPANAAEGTIRNYMLKMAAEMQSMPQIQLKVQHEKFQYFLMHQKF